MLYVPGLIEIFWVNSCGLSLSVAKLYFNQYNEELHQTFPPFFLLPVLLAAQERNGNLSQ